MGIASNIAICNNALRRLGALPIASFSDNTGRSDACRDLYDPTRRLLLRSFLWNFACSRVILAADSDAPAFEFNNQFTLPADFVRVVKLYNANMAYQIEAGKMLTNNPAPLQLKYIADTTDTTLMDDLFVEALVLLLAIKLGWTLTGEGFNPGPLSAELKEQLSMAKLVDSQDQTPTNMVISDYEDSMFTGIGPWFDPTQQGIF